MKFVLRISFLLLLLNVIIIASITAQHSVTSFNPDKVRTLRVMFYNVENVFDTIDDPGSGDDEFLPSAMRHWDWYKYRNKIQKIYKVIVSAGGWDPPGLVGFCEIENRKILEDLLHRTPFSKYQYKIVHSESPDFRGIDVAAIYREEKFQLISFRYIPVPLADRYEKTRDILYIKGKTKNADTLHIFFNHWPSKWQGELQSRPKRIKAAQVLYHHIDSLLRTSPGALILAAGDFNDPPGAGSLTDYLHAENLPDTIHPNKLYNLSAHWEALPYGTHKHQGIWQILDQFIVSGNLLNNEKGLATSPDDGQIMTVPFLLKEDERYTGTKPFRTYSGYRYEGGFSDHLPVILDFH